MRRLVPIACLIALAGCGGHQRKPDRLPVVTATATEHPAPPQRTQLPQDRSRPNIVFVLTDDMSTDLLPYVPSVRRLMRRGATFSRYFVSDSLCCPSRASILTGRLPHNTGVFTNIKPDGGLYAFRQRGNGLRTFARTLKQHGYRTALFGKYLNGYPEGSPHVPPGWTDWLGGDRGYDEFDYILNHDGHPTFFGSAPNDYLTDVLTGSGVRYIDRNAARGRPFFLELATFAPHRPAIPAPRDAQTHPDARAPRDPSFNRQMRAAPDWLTNRPPLARRTIARIDRDFRQRVRSMGAVDDLVRTIQRRLRQTGVARNTYIVFSSDNGYHLGQHRLEPGKLTAFDPDVRVPLVVAGPGVRAGARIAAITQNTDLAPTFEDLAGAVPRAGADGRSLKPFLQGRRPRDWRPYALVEHHHPQRSHKDPDRQPGESGDPPTYEAMRSRSFTYVEYTNGADRREFYDDRLDPAQLRNRYPELSPRRRARLHRRLMSLIHCQGAEQCATVRPLAPRTR